MGGRSSNRRRRTTIGGAFVPRRVEMIESPAFGALSLSGHRVLARLEVELAHHAGTDNGNLPVTFDDFEHFGIHRHAVAPGLREAEALGFIEWKHGAAGNATFRRPGLFRLTYLHTDFAEPTDEWRRIKTEAEAWQLAHFARYEKSSKKQKASGGKRHVSVAETGTETPSAPVVETTTTGHSAETATTSISREGATLSVASAQARIKARRSGDASLNGSTLAPIGESAISIIKKIGSPVEIETKTASELVDGHRRPAEYLLVKTGSKGSKASLTRSNGHTTELATDAAPYLAAVAERIRPSNPGSLARDLSRLRGLVAAETLPPDQMAMAARLVAQIEAEQAEHSSAQHIGQVPQQ